MLVIRHILLRIIPLLLTLSVVSLLGCLLDLRGGFQFGGDEGFELLKAQMVLKGERLYEDIWNDQPPFHTTILKLLFAVFGSEVLVGRYLSLGFLGILLYSLGDLVRLRSGNAAAALAMVLLCLAPGCLFQGVSVMIGLPAVAVAMLSLLCLEYHIRTRSWGLVIISGCFMGVAVQTKLTSLLFLPAVLARITLLCPAEDRKPCEVARMIALWTGAATLMVASIVACFPGESVDTILLSHVSINTLGAYPDPEEFGSFLGSIRGQMGCVVPALLQALILVCRGDWRRILPVVLMYTVFLCHMVETPYWWYYYLHFAIPSCWLAAEYITALCARVIAPIQSASCGTCKQLVDWFILCGVVFVLSFDIGATISRERPKFLEVRSHTDSAVIKTFKEFGLGARYVFTDCMIEAFYCKARAIPELALIPSKRMRSGRLTFEGIEKVLKARQPELIAVRSAYDAVEPIHSFIQSNYALARQVEGVRFYVRKDVTTKAEHNAK